MEENKYDSEITDFVVENQFAYIPTYPTEN
jgi:hypothetical protein